MIITADLSPSYFPLRGLELGSGTIRGYWVEGRLVVAQTHVGTAVHLSIADPADTSLPDSYFEQLGTWMFRKTTPYS